MVQEFYRYICNFSQNCYLFTRENLQSTKNSIYFQQNVFFFPQIACVLWYEAPRFFSTLLAFVGKFYWRGKIFRWSLIVAKLYPADRLILHDSLGVWLLYNMYEFQTDMLINNRLRLQQWNWHFHFHLPHYRLINNVSTFFIRTFFTEDIMMNKFYSKLFSIGCVPKKSSKKYRFLNF